MSQWASKRCSRESARGHPKAFFGIKARPPAGTRRDKIQSTEGSLMSKKRPHYLAIPILLLLGSAPAVAQRDQSPLTPNITRESESSASWTFNSGNDLWTLCQKVDLHTGSGRAYRGFCMGYIKGIAEVLDFQKQIHLPVGVTNGRLYDTVMNWLSNHAENRHLAALDVLYLALRQSFPPATKQ